MGHDAGGNGIDHHRIGAEAVNGGLHPAVLALAATTDETAVIDLGDAIFRLVGHKGLRHLQAQFGCGLQRNGRGAELPDVVALLEVELEVVVQGIVGQPEGEVAPRQDVGLACGQIIEVVGQDGRQVLSLASHGETIDGTIAVVVRQFVAEAIVALLVDGDPAIVVVVGLEHTQAVAGGESGAHVPGATADVFLVVGPRVEQTILVEGETADLALADKDVVDEEADIAHAVVVRCAGHVVVRSNGSPHLAPGLDDDGLLDATVLDVHVALALSAVHQSPALLRIEHDGRGTGRHIVGDAVGIELQGVNRLVGSREAHLEMKVRTEGVAGIAAQRHHLPLLDRKLVGREREVGDVGFVLVLILANALCHGGGEGIEVAIDGGVATRMSDVNGIAVAPIADGGTADVAVGHAVDRMTDGVLRLEIQPSVEMPCTQFAEVGAQQQRKVKGRTEMHSLLRSK